MLHCIAEQPLTFRSLLVFQVLREVVEDECYMNLPKVGKYLHGVTCQITWNLQSTAICDVSPGVLILITDVSGEHTASIFRVEDGGNKFLLTLLNFYQNAWRLFLQDIFHSLNSSGNISINSGEIYLPVLPVLYESNVNNRCTLLVSGEAKNSLVNYEILRIVWNFWFHYPFHNNLLLIPFTRQIILVHSHRISLKIHFNITFPSAPTWYWKVHN